MTENTELMKKIANLADGSRTSKIDSWQEGIMKKGFEPINGTADQICTEWLNRLSQVAAMLEHYHVINTEENNRPQILQDIDTFFDETTLPSIRSSIDDYKQKEGRYITIGRSDNDEKFDCLPEIYGRTIDRISEEQYTLISNKARKLYFRAIAQLPEDKFSWETEKVIVDVEPEKQFNDPGGKPFDTIE